MRLRRRQDGDRTHVGQVTVLRLLNLVDAITAPFADLAHAHGDMKLRVEMVAKLIGDFGRARAGHVHVLRHSRFVHVGVDCLRPEQDHILRVPQKLQDCAVDGSQGKGFLHDEFRERQSAVAQHGCII